MSEWIDHVHCVVCELPVPPDEPLEVLVDVTWPAGSANKVEERKHVCRECAQRIAEALEECA